MTLTRIWSMLGAVALGGVLVASTYGAQAARPPATPAPASHSVAHDSGFVPPVPHKYGANGMRMGLHCETSDSS
jgi:hypothetical protein